MPQGAAVKKPIDYDALHRAIEGGAKEACIDAGLVRFALSVQFSALIVVGGDGPEPIPSVEIEVTELTEEQADALKELRDKAQGN
jgi:hypothetical protein